MSAAMLRVTAAIVAEAALPYLSPADATEAANNLVQGLTYDDGSGAEDAARKLLAHRVRHFALRCGDVASCASVMARAWERARAKVEERAA